MVLVVQECPLGHKKTRREETLSLVLLTGLLSEIPMPLNMSKMDRNYIVGRGGRESPNSEPIS